MYPQPEGLLRLLQVAQHLRLVGRRDVELLPVAGAVAQLVGLLDALRGQSRLAHERVGEPHRRMRHREPGIELNRALEQRHRARQVAAGPQDRRPRAECAQRLDRRRRRLLERGAMLLDGGERFSDPRSKPDGDLAQRLEHIFLARRLHLLLVEDVAGAAARCAKAQHVLGPDGRDRTFQHGCARRPLADFTGYRGRQRCGRRLSHQRQDVLNPLVGDKTEERRLLKLDR